MTDWQLSSNYDFRLGAVRLQAKHNGEESPVFELLVPNLLRQIPAHEMHEYMHIAAKGEQPCINVEDIRYGMINRTDFKDKVVLDIGGYDGVMAKEALNRWAKRAICLDNHQYEHYGWEDKKHEGVEYVTGDFMEWRAESSTIPNGPIMESGPIDQLRSGLKILPLPDTIIFYNVLYHLKNPWAALDHLRTIVKPNGEMLLCSLFRYHEGSWLYLYEPRECNPTDETVYFGPSLTAIERLLKATGWDAVQEGVTYDRCVYRCKPTPDFRRMHQDS